MRRSLGNREVRKPNLLYTVWIVSSEQLLAWVKNPTPISQLNDFAPLKCSMPQVTDKICNGMPENEAGLIELCPFSDFPFYTCVRLCIERALSCWLIRVCVCG